MTIITKPLSEKKLEKQDEPLVQSETKQPLKKNDDLLVPVNVYQPLHARARNVNTATTLCACITAILVLTVGVIGGVYLYMQLSKVQMHHLQTWCTVPGEKFKEKIEIDVKYETHEDIEVPDFTGGRRGRFIHDFSSNKTGIVDIDGRRCFVMTLNRSMVLPPRSFLDLLLKMEAGYYKVDTEVVRETMVIVQPPISDYRSVGYYIARQCATVNTFLLARAPNGRHHVIDKRSIGESTPIRFKEFAGNKVLELTILELEPEMQPEIEDGVLLAT